MKSITKQKAFDTKKEDNKDNLENVKESVVVSADIIIDNIVVSNIVVINIIVVVFEVVFDGNEDGIR